MDKLRNFVARLGFPWVPEQELLQGRMASDVHRPGFLMGSPAAAYRQTETRLSRPTAFVWIEVAVIVLLLGALYFEIIPDLASEWWTVEASSYGMLVPPLTLYIVYLRREITLALPATRDLRGLYLTALGCLVFLTGRLSAEFFLGRISFVIVLAGLVWTFWGFPRLKTLAFPFVLLGTMVPLPAIVFNTIAAPLQLFASNVATNVAQTLGVSVYRDGNVIHLAQTSLGVAEACSGLNSLSALVVGALLLGFLEDASVLGRVLLVVLSIPLAIFVNVLRVAGTAVIADHNMEFAMGFYHLLSGWIVFVLGFGLLWIFGKLLFRWTRAS